MQYHSSMRHIASMLNDEIKYCGKGRVPNNIHNINDWYWSRMIQVNDCLCWGGQTDYDGYGIVGLHGYYVKTHVLAYVLHYGLVVDESPVVRHTCDNPPCCSWEHLLLGSYGDNMQDAADRMRWHRNGTHHRAKLSESDILAIRNSDLSNVKLGKLYGVSDVQVSRIRRGLFWVHI